MVVACLTVLLGCSDDSGRLDTRQTCAQLRWTCGTDDFSDNCGTCRAGQSCSAGACYDDSFNGCGSQTCGSDPSGHVCGTCGVGETCSAGFCVRTTPSCTCGVRVCGVDSCGLSSCGTCPTGQTCNAAGACASSASSAMPRTLANGDAPLFRGDYGVPFSLPVQASVGYVARSADDTFLFGIFPADQWLLFTRNDSTARAYGSAGPTSFVSNGVTLLAGNYVLGFRCANLAERCAISYSAVTSY